MTIERPMFPPRAESVDSFSPQPAIGQPENQNLTSESRKPAEGLSRRNLLGPVAALAIAPAAARAADLPPLDGFERVVDDRGRIWFKAVDDMPDPAFALIRAKRVADVKHCWAMERQAVAEHQFGRTSEAARLAAERCEAACIAAQDADWKLATTQPTTLAGIAAVLRLANLIEDEGCEWPNTDAIGPEGWHYQLRAAMAQAVETIICKGAV